MGLSEKPGDLTSFVELLQLSTLTLATIGEDGQPHAAPVYFVSLSKDRAGCSAPLQLYFFSDPESQHARDLRCQPDAAAAIYPEVEGWQEIRGLQLLGQVQLVPPGIEWEHAWEVYRAKFPFASDFSQIATLNRLYAFHPLWIRMLDNRRGFGFKQEWTLP